MRLYVLPICFGLFGAVLFWLAITTDQLPNAFSITTFPGSMLSFALIHGSEGELGYMALIAGAVLQFILYAIAGLLIAAASYLLC